MSSIHSRRRRNLQIFRTVVLLLAGLFFLIPIFAMLEFSTRDSTTLTGARTLKFWRQIFDYPDLVGFPPTNPTGILASLELAAITSIVMLVLLVPTMVWVRLKLPKMSPLIEFVCLLPLTIPAIALVVGFYGMYQWIGTNFSDSILTLAFAYIILVLPYSYRALDSGLRAIDVKTLSEAARSLGAGWFTVMWRVIVPNMSSAVLNAAFLSVALVLGEFTIANNLLYPNLQVEIAQLGRANAGVSIAVSAAALLFAFVILILLSFVGRRRRAHAEPVTISGPVQLSGR